MSKPKRVGTDLEPLIDMLASKDGMTRQKARKSLVAVGKPAVSSLTQVLQTSKLHQVRWEAAKALCAIGDTRSIPTLVEALEDNDGDVRWVAAEALRKLKKAAWPPILRGLVKSDPVSVWLCEGAHHVLLNRKLKAYSASLATLMNDLESGGITGSGIVAAHDIVGQMKAIA